MLKFRAFIIYLCLKNCGYCTWSHYTIHTQDIRMHITRREEEGGREEEEEGEGEGRERETETESESEKCSVCASRR